MSIRYFHVRDLDDYGQISSRGGMTVAYEVEDPEYMTIKYGVARCSKEDNFSKSYGRHVANTRLNSEPLTLNIPKFARQNRSVEQILREVLGE
jgi:hypothetical protein